MGFVYLNRDTSHIFAGRVGRLSAGSIRRWGKMSVGEMLEHLIQLVRVSAGEVVVEDLSSPLTRSFIGYLVFRWIPWPKGRLKTFPFMLPPAEGDVEGQKERLLQAVNCFTDLLESQPERQTVSPLLGPTTLRRWSLVHGRHLDHHLRQFGV